MSRRPFVPARPAMAALLLVLAVSAAGCGEKVQTAEGRRSDARAWQGAGDTGGQPYVASGWKAGDKGSWEEQLRLRAQAQNEYTRVR